MPFVAFVLAMGAPTVHSMLAPPTAQALPGPCSLIPDGAARKLCKAAGNGVVHSLPGIGPVAGAGIPGIPNPTSVIVGAAKDLIMAPMSSFTNYLGKGVLHVFNDIFKSLVKNNVPPSTDLWFLAIYGIVFAYAWFLAFAQAAKRLVRAAANKDPTDVASTIGHFALFVAIGGVLPFAVHKFNVETYTVMAPGWMDLFKESADATLQKLTSNFALDIAAATSGAWIVLPMLFLLVGLVSAACVEVQMLIVAPITLVLLLATVLSLGAWVGGDEAGKQATMRSAGSLFAFCWYPVILSIFAVISMKMFGNGESARATLYGAVMLMSLAWLTWKAMNAMQVISLSINPFSKVMSGVTMYRTLRP